MGQNISRTHHFRNELAHRVENHEFLDYEFSEVKLNGTLENLLELVENSTYTLSDLKNLLQENEFLWLGDHRGFLCSLCRGPPEILHEVDCYEEALQIKLIVGYDDYRYVFTDYEQNELTQEHQQEGSMILNVLLCLLSREPDDAFTNDEGAVPLCLVGYQAFGAARYITGIQDCDKFDERPYRNAEANLLPFSMDPSYFGAFVARAKESSELRFQRLFLDAAQCTVLSDRIQHGVDLVFDAVGLLDGGVALANALRQNRGPTNLRVRGSGFGGFPACNYRMSLYNALEVNTSLWELALSADCIDASRLTDMLTKNKALRSLHVELFHMDQLPPLLHCLQSHPTLQKLHMRAYFFYLDNKPSKEQVTSCLKQGLLDMLSKSTSIQYVDINYALASDRHLVSCMETFYRQDLLPLLHINRKRSQIQEISVCPNEAVRSRLLLDLLKDPQSNLSVVWILVRETNEFVIERLLVWLKARHKNAGIKRINSTDQGNTVSKMGKLSREGSPNAT